MGRAAISACEAIGIGIPEDVAVVGTDDDESLCENAAISLSSVRVNFDASGYTAARLLDVVREMGCSRRLADLRFMEAVGHTVFDEIHAVHIERVKDLLMKPRQEVFAIPNLCGYGSLADLCRDFKKRTGQTLRGWRSNGAR